MEGSIEKMKSILSVKVLEVVDDMNKRLCTYRILVGNDNSILEECGVIGNENFQNVLMRVSNQIGVKRESV
jgi:hypothetical protein